MVYIAQLDIAVQRLILAVAEAKLYYEGYTYGDEVERILENVKCEKIANVVNDLTFFVNNQVNELIDDSTYNWWD